MRALSVALGMLLAACSTGQIAGFVPPCETDLECGANKICFPEGCGDPGGGLVVEIQGNSRMGQLAQDFPIADGGFKPENDFKLLPPTALVGEFSRNASYYGDTVSLRVKGGSQLIPGVVRSYQATFVKPERGTYRLAVGAGQYVVTAEAADPSIPPQTLEVSVIPGTDTPLSFSLGAMEETIVITGRLLKRIDPGPVPINIPVSQTMDVQAFDPITLRALSQRRPVTTQDGDFELYVAPTAFVSGSLLIIATPREPGSLVPSKSFTITPPVNPELRLILGDFGEQLPQMRGDLRTSAGVPVVGASVYLEGPVNGGGTFRSKVVNTDADGVFRVDLLPSALDGSYTVTALPPPESAASVVQRQVKAVSKAGTPAYLQVVGASDDPMTRHHVICPDKITVIGTLLRPGGADPAIGTTVVAHAVEQLKELGNQPLPMGDTQVVTNESGRFELELDPGVYQLDFIPGEDLPRTTRVITVRAETVVTLDGGTPSRTIDLGETELRKGRKVSGVVRTPIAAGSNGFAINATVRYFRVSTVGGNTTSLLLGEAVTDSLGNYSLMLPSK